MRPTLLYRAYSAATFFALPFLQKKMLRRVTDHGMSHDRAREKLGYATEPRPNGTVIWFHAASVGEMMSVLALITRLGESLPKAAFLLTSGTATSAKIVATRLPPRTRHQFAPLDGPAPVSRFLKHWRPDAAILVESEIWPQMLMRTHGANIPLALVNARLSDGSVRQWTRASRTAKMLFETFRLILSQSPEMTRSLVDIGAPQDRVRTSANLKSLALKLPLDPALESSTKDALAGRPVWVAASTHPGEEEIVLKAHKALLDTHPDLCLILVPRHPERGEAVADLIKQQGWPAPRRSQGDTPNGPVYLADTVGELGTWYALGNTVFLGGSLKPIGGHNPFEPALSGVAVCSGPHVTNFKDTFDDMTKTGAATMVSDAETLAKQITLWLTSPDALSTAQTAAQTFCDGQTGRLDDIAADLIHALELSDA